MTGCASVVEAGYERRSGCPVCKADATAGNPVARSCPPAETIAFDNLGPFLSGYTSRRLFFSYFRCRVCGLLYCPVYLTQAQLDSLYRRQPENMADTPLAARERTQATYFEILRRWSRFADGYLELGSDIGLFAGLCARAGGFDHYWLYEPNEAVHEAARSRLAGRPHSIRSSQFSAADLPPTRVSTAVMIHVLDHVLAPRGLLADIHSAVQPGGIVFVVTHDADSALARWLGRRWPPFTLQHPHLFSRASLSRLFGEAGFEPLEMVKTKNYFPLTQFLRASVALLGGPTGVVPSWGWPMLGVKLGNIAAVARKT